MPRVIDCHSHLYPPEFKKIGPIHPSIYDVEGLLAEQEAAGVDISIISNCMVLAHRGEANLWDLKAIQTFHDFVGKLTAQYPKKFVGFAAAVPFRNGRYLKETERAVKEYGLKGIIVNSSVQGEYLDSERAFPFYELVCRLNLPVFVHPPSVTVGADKMESIRLVASLGRPFDTTLSIVRMILAGVLERFPMKLILAHMGGAIPMLMGRLDYGYEFRKDPGYGEKDYGPWDPERLPHPPGYYIKQLYMDTMGFHPPGIQAAIGTVGIDHVVLGSDNPPVKVPLTLTVDTVRKLPISDQEKNKILGENAAALLKL